MTRSLRRVLAFTIASFTVMAAGPVFTATQAGAEGNGEANRELGALGRINHLVVIYNENRSFDNLYGSFEDANGLEDASATSTTQVNLAGQPYSGCLPQPPAPFPTACLANGPFDITQYMAANVKTPDLVHRFYQEQFQIDGGKMDKFVAVSDAKGLAMGYYPTEQLPMAKVAANYVLSDNFFHAAFGGSFLNHQWLVCACTPVYDATQFPSQPDLHTVITNGVVTKDGQLTTASMGDFAVNTIFPNSAPTLAPGKKIQLLDYATIGDRLSAKNIDWAWYSGGWDDAVNGSPAPTFQFHHQAFNYYTKYAKGGSGRAHLQDETKFFDAAQAGTLPAVSFVKPLGINNEHPGYADLITGENHLLKLIDAVKSGPNWKDTAIVITYDENGGFWDHVGPPTDAKHSDKWGPGTRVPTIIISPLAKRGYIDHTLYDTTSILTTIEHRWNLEPLGTRDATANDLRHAFTFGEGGDGLSD
jgi:phospholipase C